MTRARPLPRIQSRINIYHNLLYFMVLPVTLRYIHDTGVISRTAYAQHRVSDAVNPLGSLINSVVFYSRRTRLATIPSIITATHQDDTRHYAARHLLKSNGDSTHPYHSPLRNLEPLQAFAIVPCTCEPAYDTVVTIIAGNNWRSPSVTHPREPAPLGPQSRMLPSGRLSTFTAIFFLCRL